MLYRAILLLGIQSTECSVSFPLSTSRCAAHIECSTLTIPPAVRACVRYAFLALTQAKQANISTAPLWLPIPRLVDLQSPVPHSIASFTVCPAPVAATYGSKQHDAMVLLAATTGTGMLDVLTLRNGLGGRVFPVINTSLQVESTATYYSAAYGLPNPDDCIGHGTPGIFVYVLLYVHGDFTEDLLLVRCFHELRSC